MQHPYVQGQLARALVTASQHEDPATRTRADRRVADWTRVLRGMADGSIRVGSRTPVAGLPAWVSLEVLRGGFATGAPSAGGPLTDAERERIALLGSAPERQAVFASHLTDAGLDELDRQLRDRTYAIDVPEAAVLPVVAWLATHEGRDRALDLLATVGPFADQLRFAPATAEPRSTPLDHISRRTAGQVRVSLLEVRPDTRIERQRTVLAVWLPLSDAFCDLWSTGTAESLPAQRLLEAYDVARQGVAPRRFTHPKENLPILVLLTRTFLAGRFTEADSRRVRHVVEAITASRGGRGSEQRTVLRAGQAAVAALPSRQAYAEIAATRCAGLPADDGFEDLASLTAPVQAAEAAGNVPAGTLLPRSATRRLALGRSASIEELLADGAVSSAEVLAELLPALTAVQIGASFPDPELGSLMAATYEAFQRRRSLLLTELESQVRFEELPWLRAVRPYATREPADARRLAQRVSALALDFFPGTILPNPLVQELKTLYATAGTPLPFTREIAADIFAGDFSDPFRQAARAAADLLDGTLYARYFGLDYAAVRALPTPPPERSRFAGRPARPAGPTFGALVDREVPHEVGSWIVRNGMVIERSQQYTTHNLALLVAAGNVRPERSWSELTRSAGELMLARIRLARRQPHPLATVKDAAYAWRQALFFATMAAQETGSPTDSTAALTAIADRAEGDPAVAQILGGAAYVARGGTFDAAGRCPGGRRFTGWTDARPWVLVE